MFPFKKIENREFNIKCDSYYYDEKSPLLSIHLASNRPIQFTQFVEGIHTGCINKNAYEIIVKIDSEDIQMIECTTSLAKKYGEYKIKPHIRPKKQGPWSTWEYYNEMFHLTHQNAYFLWNPSDEVRILTAEWDKILKKYIAFYPDHIFRLKLSDNRLRNFYKLDDALRNPDNFPFMTKKWMDLCGVWGDCHSPDLFHQAVSFYLGKLNIFRDIPIFDITLSGIEAGLFISPDKALDRINNIRKLWLSALSKSMRSRYIAHANKINLYIQFVQAGRKEIKIYERITYPSKVKYNTSFGTQESIKCVDKTIVTFALSLINEYIRSKIKRFISLFVTKPIKIFFLSPFPTLIFAFSSILLFIVDLPLSARIISIVMLVISAWQLGVNSRNEVEILRSKLRF